MEDDPATGQAREVCRHNVLLSNLRGLRGLTSIGGDLIVNRNPAIPTCEAEWLRDSVGVPDIAGSIDLSGNSSTGTCP